VIARTYIGLGRILKRIKTSAKESLGTYELKQHKPWFDEECLGLLIKGSRLECTGFKPKQHT